MIAGESTALAALSIVASIAAALVWLLKKLFTQNDTTLRHSAQATKENSMATKELATAVASLARTLEANDEARRSDRESDREYQKFVRKTLNKVSDKQDVIHDIVAKSITVENMYVHNKEDE